MLDLSTSQEASQNMVILLLSNLMSVETHPVIWPCLMGEDGFQTSSSMTSTQALAIVKIIRHTNFIGITADDKNSIITGNNNTRGMHIFK